MEAEVLFNPFEKQLEFLEAVFDDSLDIILYGGAIRGGKTFAGLGALLLLCKKYPKSRWAIVRTDLQTLKRNTIPSFNKICPQSFLKSYNQDTQTVTFQNESQIIFFAENYDKDKELNRWKGLEVNGFLLEEVNELQEASFNKAIERAGSLVLKDQPPKKILATCNPAHNWVKEKFYDRWKSETLPSKWLYIPAKISDNPFIPKDYLEGLKELPAYDYEVFVNGNWEIQPKTGYEFYKSFNTDYHRKKLTYNKDKALHVSLDFNVVPYMTMTVWQIYKQGKGWRLECIKEYTTRPPKNTTLGIATEFLKDFGNHYNGLFYYGDPSGKKRDTRVQQGGNDFTILHNALKDLFPKDKVLRAAPSVTARGNFINSLFENKIEDCEVIIDESCTELITDLTNLKEDADGKKLKERDSKEGISFEKYGHCFIAGTLVKTQRGDIPIEDVVEGDYALTRKGYKKVVWSGLTRKNALVKTYRIGDNEITCTPDHQIWTKKGFKEVKSLMGMNIFCIFENKKICEKRLNITEVNSIDTQKAQISQTKGILKAGVKSMTNGLKSIFIDTFGELIMGIYQNATMFIIKTTTLQTTTYPTLSYSTSQNTYYTTTTNCQKSKRNIKRKSLMKKQDLKLLNGIQAKRGESGIANTLRMFTRRIKELLNVRNVEKKEKQETQEQGFVVQDVRVDTTQESFESVYDITVEDEHEFFANNILVHNCSDSMDYFICKILEPQYKSFIGKKRKLLG